MECTGTLFSVANPKSDNSFRQVDPDTDKSRSWQVGKIISTEIFFFKNKKIIDAKSEMNEITDTVK